MPALSSELIVTTALDLVEERGEAALSMRRLGAALGVEAMSLYHHVESRDALLRALAGRLMEPLASIELGADWRPACGRFARALRAVGLERPVAFRLVALEPFDTPVALRTVERLLDVLVGAGHSPPVALGVYRAVASYTRGYMLSEAVGFTVDAHGPEARIRLGDLEPAEFPHLSDAALRHLDPQGGFELGLAALLAGFPEPVA